MTSPPYFNMEIYDSAVEQSVSTTDTSPLQEKYWYENYLLVWMNKCFHALKKGGIIKSALYQVVVLYMYAYMYVQSRATFFFEQLLRCCACSTTLTYV